MYDTLKASPRQVAFLRDKRGVSLKSRKTEHSKEDSARTPMRRHRRKKGGRQVPGNRGVQKRAGRRKERDFIDSFVESNTIIERS